MTSDPHRSERAAEDLLVRLRPDLDAAARERIERRVMGAPARRARRRWAPVLGLAGGLAALLLVLVAFGAALLPQQANVSLATPNCYWAEEPVTTSVPRIVVRADGTRQLESVDRDVMRFVRHCR